MSYMDQPEEINEALAKLKPYLVLTANNRNVRLKLRSGHEVRARYLGTTFTAGNGRTCGHGCMVHYRLLDADWDTAVELNEIAEIANI